MIPEKEQQDTMRRSMDQHAASELLSRLDVNEMRQALLFLQQTLSAHGKGVVRGQFTPNEPLEVPTFPPEKPKGVLKRLLGSKTPTQAQVAAEQVAAKSEEEERALEGRRIMLYRRLGHLSVEQLDEVQLLINRLSPIEAADNEGDNHA